MSKPPTKPTLRLATKKLAAGPSQIKRAAPAQATSPQRCQGEAATGQASIKAAEAHMPAVAALVEAHHDACPLRGTIVTMGLHITAPAGVLARALHHLGAHVRLGALHTHSTDDTVAAALKHDGMDVYGRHGQKTSTLVRYQKLMLTTTPPADLWLDPSGRLLNILTTPWRKPKLSAPLAIATAAGTAMEVALSSNAELPCDLMNLCRNDSQSYFASHRLSKPLIRQVLTRFFTDIDSAPASAETLVVGYGSLGQAVALALRDLAMEVTVVEVDAVRAYQAMLAGFKLRRILGTPSWHGPTRSRSAMGRQCADKQFNPEHLAPFRFIFTTTGIPRVFDRAAIIPKMAPGSYLINMSDEPGEIYLNLSQGQDDTHHSCPAPLKRYPSGQSQGHHGPAHVHLVGDGQSLLHFYPYHYPPQALDLIYAHYAKSLVDLSYQPMADICTGPEQIGEPSSARTTYAMLPELSPELATAYINAHQHSSEPIDASSASAPVDSPGH